MESQPTQDIRLQGIGVSSGIIIGKAFLVEQGTIEIPTYSLHEKDEIEKETKIFLKAIETTRSQFLETKKKIREKGFKKGDFIIDAYLMILEDKLLVKETTNHIRKEKINAAWALRSVLNNLQKAFSEIEDNYLRERKTDLDYVGQRILQNLMGTETINRHKVSEKVIIVAHDLSPADSVHLDLEKVLGFVTDVGGRTSHTAIMARALQIPAVVGLETATRQIQSGDTIIVDGISGEVIIHPSPNVFNDYLTKKEKYDYSEKELLKFKPLLAETRDGYRIRLLANIEITEELPSVLHYGAEGIGLYRTEFLYLNRPELPSEEQHFQTYRKVIEKISPNPTTIRTFDLGGDKFISRINVAQEMNPALGLRAIRLGLREVDLFKTQIRAILRASALGKVRMLFPMVSGIEEIYRIKEIITDVKEELKSKGQPFDPDIEIGVMIEIPSAVVIADLLAKEVDFFSIGTNDLIQYLLAIDRVNEHVSHLYRPLHPAVLRFIKRTVDAAHAEGIRASMCGEMAGEPFYTPILLGFGIDELSMNALSLLRVKKIIRSAYYRECQQLANEILKFSVTKQVENFLQQELFSRFSEELKDFKLNH
ncbi:MAG TPA: phosphoenolpyruvate--protein phosphotransferase [Thermodesulfobacteriota bacterium]|nr:phosphoenolpyruvate--protein phosphotransferase [Thermodesulfobacteriota bacterium]